MNTSSRLAAFIVVAANDDAGLRAGANDYLNMCGSMLWVGRTTHLAARPRPSPSGA
jgi:hypothetical protein